MADERPFIKYFDLDQRGWIYNLFLNAVRQAHMSTASDVYRWVFADVKRRIEGGYNNRNGEVLKQIVSYLLDYSDEAMALADQALVQDEIPADVKAARRAEMAEVGKQRWMRQQPPTPAQLGYIRSLGHKGEPPANRWEASQLIERLKGHAA